MLGRLLSRPVAWETPQSVFRVLSRTHPRGRLTGRPYPRPLPLLCFRGGEGAQRGAGRNDRDPLLGARTGLSFPEVRASLCDLPPPPPGGLPVPPGGTHAGVEGVGVPGPSGWAPARLRRRQMESQHSPWVWGPAVGMGSLRAPFAHGRRGTPCAATARSQARLRLSAADPPRLRPGVGVGVGAGPGLLAPPLRAHPLPCQGTPASPTVSEAR